MLGLWPSPEDGPQAERSPDVRRIALWSRCCLFSPPPKPGSCDGEFVSGRRLREYLNENALPAIVYVWRASGKGRDGNNTAFQDHGFVRQQRLRLHQSSFAPTGEIPASITEPMRPLAHVERKRNPRIACGGTRSATALPP